MQRLLAFDSAIIDFSSCMGVRYIQIFALFLSGKCKSLKKKTASVKKCSDYANTFLWNYPFGLTMPGRSSNTANPNDNYKFAGYERDDESGLNIYYMIARGMDPVLGRFMQIDPMLEFSSPYSYVGNNPLNLIDPTGMFSENFSIIEDYSDEFPFFERTYYAGPPSTHTDADGNVVAVYDDGDTGVYSHNKTSEEIRKDTQACQRSGDTACGGTRQGETEYWDEFISPETRKPMTDVRIMFGFSFDPIVAKLHADSENYNLIELAEASRGGRHFDLKTKEGYRNVGGLLNGKYVTSRSAGNYLAGLNASGRGIGFNVFQRLAGALHTKSMLGELLTKGEMINIVVSGQAYGPPPAYGEFLYQYRMSKAGWNSKN